MRIISQVFIYFVTWVIVLILGNFFDDGFFQAGIHAKKIMGDKPLPILFQFFVEHHHLPGHLALLPWLGFVGAPLLALSTAKQYWDVPLFTLRFLAFFSCEFLLFLVLIFAILMPFIPYYGLLQNFEESATELAVRLMFWGGLIGVLILGVGRLLQIRRAK